MRMAQVEIRRLPQQGIRVFELALNTEESCFGHIVGCG